ncbi:MAG: hypothetical protein J3R72DRAFT_492835 [Linnemannia gamsii]|nr:MAG: hypothetical protein J3R72DRAFT_492835 [Linnemannia gamsii]
MTCFPSDLEPPATSGYQQSSHIHQILWLVLLNRNTITSLDLAQLDLGSRRVIRDISRTISKLCLLKILQLRLLASHGAFTPTLDPVKGEWDFYQGPLIMRNEPLIQLKRLTLPSMCTTSMSRIYFNILRQCPSLETLEMPCISVLSDEANRAIASIGELCPHISNLSFLLRDCSGEMVCKVADAIQEKQLRGLCWSIHEITNTSLLTTTWTRHSTSLQRIELLAHSTRIESLVIKTALTTCCTLKVFKAIGSDIQSDVGLLLSHTIEHAWVCKELRELEIDISITAVGNNDMYLVDPTKATWTAHDHRGWDELGRFYAQIGSLTHLEVLCLSAARSIRNPSEYHGLASTSADACLSGLLALEDFGAGQIGYLSKLAGLTKLRELRGSFGWTNKETQARIGDQEVDWFVNHLPALRMATFMCAHHNRLNGWQPVHEHLRFLQVKRPGLEIGHSF